MIHNEGHVTGSGMLEGAVEGQLEAVNGGTLVLPAPEHENGAVCQGGGILPGTKYVRVIYQLLETTLQVKPGRTLRSES
jgi:hypothetical protein